MRIVIDFRVPSDGDWRTSGQRALQSALADYGVIAPADPSDSRRIMELITADMSEEDLSNFKLSVRYVARQFAGPVGAVNVLRDGYLRLRLRSNEFEGLFSAGQGIVTAIMDKYGPETPHQWELKRCEIRERGGGRGFLYGAWVPGVRRFSTYLFSERRGSFIVGLFVLGLMLEAILSYMAVDHLSIGAAGTIGLGLRLGAPMLISSTVLMLERYAQWRDQRGHRLLWAARPKQIGLQRQNIES